MVRIERKALRQKEEEEEGEEEEEEEEEEGIISHSRSLMSVVAPWVSPPADETLLQVISQVHFLIELECGEAKN